MKLRILALTLIAIQARAQVHTPLPVGASSLGLGSPVSEKLRQTTYKMTISADGSFCTAFPVTRDGYLLTALHCLRDCLVSQDQMQTASAPSIGLTDLMVVKNPQSVGAVCKQVSIPALGVQQIQVVATGPALSVYRASFLGGYSGFYQELNQRDWTSKAHDYALIKINPPSNLACLKIHAGAPVAGQSLWAVGYPETVGHQPTVLSASFGLLYGSPEVSQAWQRQSTPEDQNWIKTQFTGAGVMFASAANNPGQSGGPVILQDGSVVGIVSGFMPSQDNQGQEVHELVAVLIEKMQSEWLPGLAQEILIKNQDCSPPAALNRER